ncbi:MAG: hypothetical protein HC836_49555 [Richelia sp. RM2_1_2]|nr:hypothetical protein [Richelia sp. RM2_1_2]
MKFDYKGILKNIGKQVVNEIWRELEVSKNVKYYLKKNIISSIDIPYFYSTESHKALTQFLFNEYPNKIENKFTKSSVYDESGNNVHKYEIGKMNLLIKWNGYHIYIKKEYNENTDNKDNSEKVNKFRLFTLKQHEHILEEFLQFLHENYIERLNEIETYIQVYTWAKNDWSLYREYLPLPMERVLNR